MSVSTEHPRATVDSMPAANPFDDPLRFERRVPECTIVIFGANGDLAKRKLMPALYRLAYDRRLPPGFAIVGKSRTPLTDDQFRGKMREAVQQFSEDTEFSSEVWDAFARGFRAPREARRRASFSGVCSAAPTAKARGSR